MASWAPAPRGTRGCWRAPPQASAPPGRGRRPASDARKQGTGVPGRGVAGLGATPCQRGRARGASWRGREGPPRPPTPAAHPRGPVCGGGPGQRPLCWPPRCRPGPTPAASAQGKPLPQPRSCFKAKGENLGPQVHRHTGARGRHPRTLAAPAPSRAFPRGSAGVCGRLHPRLPRQLRPLAASWSAAAARLSVGLGGHGQSGGPGRAEPSGAAPSWRRGANRGGLGRLWGRGCSAGRGLCGAGARRPPGLTPTAGPGRESSGPGGPERARPDVQGGPWSPASADRRAAAGHGRPRRPGAGTAGEGVGRGPRPGSEGGGISSPGNCASPGS